MRPTFDVVIPTAGRPQLVRVLAALAGGDGPLPRSVVVVDDRRAPDGPLPVPPLALGCRLEVVRSGGRGPAAARNAGWRAGRAEWVAFLDDDVVPADDWRAALAADLAAAGPRVAGSQGCIDVPARARPTDAERHTLGLESAAWATADMAYRRAALAVLDGFDERFGRAYREDADLALRSRRRGWALVRGTRRTTHPVRPERWWASVARQRGNADDRLMAAIHGAGWRERAEAGPTRLPQHAAATAALLLAGALAATRRPRGAAAAGAAFLTQTLAFAGERLPHGIGDAQETATMLATSAAIPPVACANAAVGQVRARRAVGRGGPRESPLAVLFDRDGTLVHDVPYNGDPAAVAPVPGAREALGRLRAAGVRLGVVTNQSGIGRRLVTRAQVAAVNDRIEELLGPFDVWCVCPHKPEDGCACRKPRPGLVVGAARRLRVDPRTCAVVGDIGSDIEAARAAGALGVLVPTAVTRADEVRIAPVVAGDLAAAVDLLLRESRA